MCRRRRPSGSRAPKKSSGLEFTRAGSYLRRVWGRQHENHFIGRLSPLNRGERRLLRDMIPNEPKITPELVAEHGLKPDEYERIVQLIGREPTITELGIFSAMWNEHCSYKSSKIHLKTLPTSGPQVIQGPGENAGVISIGDGLAVVF